MPNQSTLLLAPEEPPLYMQVLTYTSWVSHRLHVQIYREMSPQRNIFHYIEYIHVDLKSHQKNYSCIVANETIPHIPFLSTGILDKISLRQNIYNGIPANRK